jgi:hypothetical protein
MTSLTPENPRLGFDQDYGVLDHKFTIPKWFRTSRSQVLGMRNILPDEGEMEELSTSRRDVLPRLWNPTGRIDIFEHASAQTSIETQAVTNLEPE